MIVSNSGLGRGKNYYYLILCFPMRSKFIFRYKVTLVLMAVQRESLKKFAMAWSAFRQLHRKNSADIMQDRRKNNKKQKQKKATLHKYPFQLLNASYFPFCRNRIRINDGVFIFLYIIDVRVQQRKISILEILGVIPKRELSFSEGTQKKKETKGPASRQRPSRDP